MASAQKDLTPYDFGAVGDGVTDDTAAIQRCIDEAAARTCGVNFKGEWHCKALRPAKGRGGDTKPGD